MKSADEIEPSTHEAPHLDSEHCHQRFVLTWARDLSPGDSCPLVAVEATWFPGCSRLSPGRSLVPESSPCDTALAAGPGEPVQAGAVGVASTCG